MHRSVSICLAGDCTGYNLLEVDDPLKNFRDTISKADIFMFNLEGVVISPSIVSSHTGLPPNPLMKPLVRMLYGTQPCLYSLPAFLKTLNVCKFNIASIANNHILDYGRIGIAQTRKHLSENDILFLGAGLNPSDACRPLTINVGKYRAGFLNYCVVGKVRPLGIEIFSAGLTPIRMMAGYGAEGVASFKKCRMERQIKDLKKRVDFVVVSLHVGAIWQSEADREQLNLVSNALRSGANLVVCHHAHVPKGIMITATGGLAFLGMGDFVFNYNFEIAKSFIAFLHLYEEKIDVEIHPVKLIKGVPTQPSEREAMEILTKLRQLSKPKNYFRISNQRGFLTVMRD